MKTSETKPLEGKCSTSGPDTNSKIPAATATILNAILLVSLSIVSQIIVVLYKVDIKYHK
jgi:hypothetical protein